MLRFSLKWMPFDQPSYVYPSIGVLSYLQEHAAEYRVFGNIYNEALIPFRLQGIEGYDPLYIQRYGEFVEAVNAGIVRPPQRSVVSVNKHGEFVKKYLDLLGTRYFVHSKGDGKNIWAFPVWDYPDSFGTPIWSDEKYEIYQNEKAFPRAFVVYDYVFSNSDQEIIDTMFSEDIDLRSTIVLENNPSIDNEAMRACQITGDSPSVSIDNYTPNRVSIEINSDCPGLLFLSDNYYPGWNAFVDNNSVPIYRADYTFRAVAIPKGPHTVVFTYNRIR